MLFSSSRFGFKDEAPMSDIPQPYGELIVMKLRRIWSTAADRQPMGGRHASLAAGASARSGDEIDAIVPRKR